MIFKFRVISDEIETFLRVIEISETDTFESLHKSIQNACGFDNSQIASFYVSNEDWEKKYEISLFDMMDEENPTLQMSDTILSDHVSKIEDNLIYAFDFFGDRALFLVLAEIKQPEGVLQYPYCSHSTGIAPELMPSPDGDLTAILDDINLDDEIDEDMFSSGGFEELPDDI